MIKSYLLTICDTCKKEVNQGPANRIATYGGINPLNGWLTVSIMGYSVPDLHFCCKECLVEYHKRTPIEKSLKEEIRQCPECKSVMSISAPIAGGGHKEGCQTVWGRRGWRKVGEHDS